LFWFFWFCFNFKFYYFPNLDRLVPIIALLMFTYEQCFNLNTFCDSWNLLFFWFDNFNIGLNVGTVCSDWFHLCTKSFSLHNGLCFFFVCLRWGICLNLHIEIIRWPSLALFIFSFGFLVLVHQNYWSLLHVHRITPLASHW